MGDLGGFFMGGALMVIFGIVTPNRIWLQAAALLTAMVAIHRIIAAAVYGADLVVEAIVVEILITAVLLFASSRLQAAFKPRNL
jgi:hypothetical protein